MRYFTNKRFTLYLINDIQKKPRKNMKATYSARFGSAEKKTPILWLKYMLNRSYKRKNTYFIDAGYICDVWTSITIASNRYLFCVIEWFLREISIYPWLFLTWIPYTNFFHSVLLTNRTWVAVTNRMPRLFAAGLYYEIKNSNSKIFCFLNFKLVSFLCFYFINI